MLVADNEKVSRGEGWVFPSQEGGEGTHPDSGFGGVFPSRKPVPDSATSALGLQLLWPIVCNKEKRGRKKSASMEFVHERQIKLMPYYVSNVRRYHFVGLNLKRCPTSCIGGITGGIVQAGTVFYLI